MAKVSLSLSGYRPAQGTKVPSGGEADLWMVAQAYHCRLSVDRAVMSLLRSYWTISCFLLWLHQENVWIVFQTAHTFRAANQEARCDATGSHNPFINRSCRLLCWFLETNSFQTNWQQDRGGRCLCSGFHLKGLKVWNLPQKHPSFIYTVQGRRLQLILFKVRYGAVNHRADIETNNLTRLRVAYRVHAFAFGLWDEPVNHTAAARTGKLQTFSVCEVANHCTSVLPLAKSQRRTKKKRPNCCNCPVWIWLEVVWKKMVKTIVSNQTTKMIQWTFALMMVQPFKDICLIFSV